MKLIPRILISFGLTVIVAIALAYFFRNNLQYIYSDLILDNRDTILFDCSEFPDEAKLAQVSRDLPQTDPEFYALVREIYTAETINPSPDEDIMHISEVGERCPGKWQFEIVYNGHESRVKLEKYLPDGKLQGIPVFLRNV